MNKLLLLLSIAVISSTACNLSTNTSVNANAQNTANAATNANVTNSSGSAEGGSAMAENANKPADEMPTFAQGEDYKKVREKLIKAGWTPFKSKDAQECDGDSRCTDFPEMEACAGTGLANCRYLWKKNKKTLAIFTIGEDPGYKGQEFVANSEQSEADKSDRSWTGGATVFEPPSRVRESPAGKVICVIREKKMITINGSTNITDDDGEWIRTNACGRPGVIHSTQIVVAN